MWRNSFSYNFLKTWTHPQVVFKDFAYFLGTSFLRNLSVGASGNKKSTTNLKNNTNQIKIQNTKYSTKFFEEYLKTSVLCISVKVTLQVSSAIKTNQPSQALIYCMIESCILIIVFLASTRNIQFTGAAIKNVHLIKNRKHWKIPLKKSMSSNII